MIEQELVSWTPADMLEISLDEPDDFLKIKETLTRIGVSSKKEHNTLYQSCHILHKQGRYFIVHFKELFMLDGKPSNFTLDDVSPPKFNHYFIIRLGTFNYCRSE